MLKKISPLVVALLLSACTVTYLTRDLRDHANQMSLRVDEPLREIKRDQLQKQNIIKSLKSSRADFSIFPFNQLEKNFGEMSKIVDEIEGHKRSIDEKHIAFKKLEKEKERINKSDPDYEKVNNYKDFAEDTKEKVEDKVDEYIELSKAFSGLAKKSEIYHLDLGQIGTQLDVMQKQMNVSLDRNERNMSKARKSVMKLPKDQRSEKLKILDEMSTVLSELKGQSLAVISTGNELRQLFPNSKKIVIGPHMKSHGFIKNIRQHSNKINSLASRFNQLNQQLGQ